MPKEQDDIEKVLNELKLREEFFGKIPDSVKTNRFFSSENEIEKTKDYLEQQYFLLYKLSTNNLCKEKHRKLLANEWLRFYLVLAKTFNPKHNFSATIYMNISVDGHYPSEVVPEFIKEPDIRKDYEERLAKNTKLGRKRKIQSTVKDLIDSVLKESQKFFIDAYSKAPRADAEIVELLEKYNYPEEDTAKVLKTLNIPYQVFREWQSKDGKFKVTAKFILV
ncbi:hypothetical protein FACS18942_00050 [Planctomycetales bacterium]|nr:hypothetical protein FACS18942_00050 [Planctomycetales bacterium]